MPRTHAWRWGASALLAGLLLPGAVGASRPGAIPSATTPLPGPPAAAADSIVVPQPGTARVTYLSGGTVYLDAGSLDGLKVGQVLDLSRGGRPIGTLRVDFLASHRAACTPDSVGVATIGDMVRFEPTRPESRATGVTASGAAASNRRRRGSWLRRNGLRGRLGARLLAVHDLRGEGGGFRQPSLDARLDGTRIGGSNFDLSIDARTRRTYRTNADAQDPSVTRVYRMSLAHQAVGSRLRVSAGRLAAASLSSVNLFDGVLTEYLGSRMATGVFAGSQPGTRDWNYSREIMEYGGYVRYQNASTAPRRWSVTGGGVASIRGSVTNRDYFFARGQWNDARIFAFASQEIDLNRGWRREMESGALSWTSTLANIQVRPSDRVTLSGGYDNRRNVRLYDDRETPESEFDAAHRQGWSGGLSLYPLKNLSLAGDVRVNGSGADRSDASTLNWRATQLSTLSIDLGGRHTSYGNPHATGWLHAWTLGGGLGEGRRLEVHAGLRDERPRDAASDRLLTRWYGANLDIGFARSFYLLLSAERTRGDLEKNDQAFFSVSYQL